MRLGLPSRTIAWMARWHAEITGHSFDLEELPRLFTAPEFRVCVDEGRYFLEAATFEALTESPAVHESAKALLPQINGVAKLMNTSFHDVNIGPIREHSEKGETREHVTLEIASSEIRMKAGLVALKVGGETPKPSAPGTLDSDKWLRNASKDAHRRRALNLWGGKHDPTSLWKVWELVRLHSGIAIDPNMLRRFRPALNDRAVSGEAARHDVSRLYPVEPDTMSLEDAEFFLGGLLTQWLNSV